MSHQPNVTRRYAILTVANGRDCHGAGAIFWGHTAATERRLFVLDAVTVKGGRKLVEFVIESAGERVVDCCRCCTFIAASKLLLSKTEVKETSSGKSVFIAGSEII